MSKRNVEVFVHQNCDGGRVCYACMNTPEKVRRYRNNTVKRIIELGVELPRDSMIQFIECVTIQQVDALNQKIMARYIASKPKK